MRVGHRRLDRGFLVSFEGIDGVGKSTQMERMRAYLTRQQWTVDVFREPGGTAFGEALRNTILHQFEPESALAEFLVFAAARAELMETSVLPALSRGHLVMMDRFVDSSVAYQAFGRGLDRGVVMAINQHATQGREPDLTLWFRGEPFTHEIEDHMERRADTFFQKVLAGYDWLEENSPQRWERVDASGSEDQVFEDICHIIERRLADYRGGGEA